jgi:hypothetical protein
VLTNHKISRFFTKRRYFALQFHLFCVINIEEYCHFDRKSKKGGRYERAIRVLLFECGYYGYYQLPKNAVCPKCSVDMVPLSISFQDFMDLSCEERDDLLSKQIISASSPYVKRLMAPHKAYNNREFIARMSDRIVELEAENKKLNETVEWMHQTIWDLVRKNKGIEPAGKSSLPSVDENSTDGTGKSENPE